MKKSRHLKVSWQQLEEAFINGYISLEEFASVLIDNFGLSNAMQIMKNNIERIPKDDYRLHC